MNEAQRQVMLRSGKTIEKLREVYSSAPSDYAIFKLLFRIEREKRVVKIAESEIAQAFPDADSDFYMDSEGEDNEPIGSCESCYCNIYEGEGPLCDQCEWWLDHA